MDSKLICFITTGDIKTNAAAKRALGMANPLINQGWEVHIVMLNSVENHNKSALECSEKVVFHFIPPLNALSEIIEKRNLIKKIKPHYVYLCGFVIRNYTPYLLLKKPIILVEHSELTSSIPLLSIINKTKAKLLEYLSGRYAHYLICASKFLQNYYSKRIEPNRILYLPYAFDHGLYHLWQGENEIIPPKDKRIKMFLYVGSITDNYGLFTMLRACFKLSKKETKFKLILAGTGKDVEKAKQFVEDFNISEYVEILGYVGEEELIRYFNMIDCFIAPLHDTVQDWARCPSKLFLYLPYIKPIITCKIGEAIELFGNNGIYFDIGSSENLAEKMEAIINNTFTYLPIDHQIHTWEYRAIQFQKFLLS
jgi:glycosyltransferase involved in cell wall biosynthesis